MEIWGWMQTLEDRVEQTFGDRLVCFGLMGSFARGEAHEDSDIDPVLILDAVSMSDLQAYREILKWLPHREKICGFVSGKEELEKWDRTDLFQFCMDTQVIRGSLEFAKELLSVEDARRAVHVGACNLYHGAVHSIMHEQKIPAMAALYKSAFFVLRAHYFVKTGVYVRSHRELAECLTGGERQLVYDAMTLRSGSESDGFEHLARRMMEVSSALIREYGGAE